MVISALRSLEVRIPTQLVRRKLELSHLTPVKGSHLQDTNQAVTAESRLLFISKCDGCGELVQPSNLMYTQKCTSCGTLLGIPVEYAINDDINYESAVLEKYKVSSPTPLELIMAGLALSAKDRATQASHRYISYFPSWPFTER
jgi:hypothetical protein